MKEEVQNEATARQFESTHSRKNILSRNITVIVNKQLN